MDLPFTLVDVFGNGPFSGNPLAVVHDATALDADTMQRITGWLNLSETTFLLPLTQPGADYRVRIFTLDRELPFAGHPTLGTCQAWLARGGVPRSPDAIVQECGAGLVSVRRIGGQLGFAAPPLLRDVRWTKPHCPRWRPSCRSTAPPSSTRNGRTTAPAGSPSC